MQGQQLWSLGFFDKWDLPHQKLSCTSEAILYDNASSDQISTRWKIIDYRGVFRTQSEIYDGAVLAKIVMGFYRVTNDFR